MLAAVHTQGINWESWAAIVIAILSPTGVFIGYLLRRADRNRVRMEALIKDQVEVVGNLLNVRFDGLNDRMERVERRQDRTEPEVIRERREHEHK